MYAKRYLLINIKYGTMGRLLNYKEKFFRKER